MHNNVNSNTENIIDKSLEDVSQEATEISVSSSTAMISQAETSDPPLKVAGALTPDGRKVPLPDNPNIPRSPFGIIDPATHKVWIQLTEQPDNSITGEEAVFNYYRHEGYYLSECNIDQIISIINEQINSGLPSCNIRFDNATAYQQALNGLRSGTIPGNWFCVDGLNAICIYY